MQLLESGEMYLETLLILTRERSGVRAIDIGDYMGFSKPSVSRALGLLREGGYVTSDKDGMLSLTEDGRFVAEKIYERHRMLTGFLMKLGVSESAASADACKIEHDISDETFEAIKTFAAGLEN